MFLFNFISPSIQCLKESQKVSVIERKSSNKNERSGVIAVKSTQSNSLTTANNSGNNNSIGSNGGNGGGGGFFKLFSSSKTKSSQSVSRQNYYNDNSSLPYVNNESNGLSNSIGMLRGDVSSISTNTDSETVMNDATSCGIATMLNDRKQQICNSDRLTIKSISVDSASSVIMNNQIDSIPIEPSMPSNEILFRKYFTFYDLLSAVNLNRLFLDSNLSNLNGPSPSLLDLNRGTTPNSNVATSSAFESSTLSSTSSYSSCASSMSSASHQIHSSINATSVANSFGTLCSSSNNTKSNSPFPLPLAQKEIGNELLAASPNFLNE